MKKETKNKTIKVKVLPNSKFESIEKICNDEYKIKVREKAIDGRANKRLIGLLAREFGVFERDIFIKNPTSRKKIIEVRK